MVSAELSSEGRPFYIHVSLSPASAPHPSPKCSQSLQGGLAGRRGIAAVPKIAPQAAGGPRGLARGRHGAHLDAVGLVWFAGAPSGSFHSDSSLTGNSAPSGQAVVQVPAPGCSGDLQVRSTTARAHERREGRLRCA